MTGISRREFARLGAAFASVAMLGTRGFAAPPASAADPEWMRLVDPELRPIVLQIQKMIGNRPPLSDRTLAEQRAGMARYVKPPLASVQFTQRQIPGARGASTPPGDLRQPVDGERAAS